MSSSCNTKSKVRVVSLCGCIRVCDIDCKPIAIRDWQTIHQGHLYIMDLAMLTSFVHHSLTSSLLCLSWGHHHRRIPSRQGNSDQSNFAPTCNSMFEPDEGKYLFHSGSAKDPKLAPGLLQRLSAQYWRLVGIHKIHQEYSSTLVGPMLLIKR